MGVIVSQDLRWSKNTEYICSKARQKLWILRRIDKLELSEDKLFDVYSKEIRSILELAVPVWHSGLTKTQSNDIERIQKLAFKLILKSNYLDYKTACKRLSTKTLQERRVQLCRNFARKNFKSDFSMLEKLTKNSDTRQQNRLVKEFKCNTDRFYKSSLPYLARLLNTTTIS